MKKATLGILIVLLVCYFYYKKTLSDTTINSATIAPKAELTHRPISVVDPIVLLFKENRIEEGIQKIQLGDSERRIHFYKSLNALLDRNELSNEIVNSELFINYLIEEQMSLANLKPKEKILVSKIISKLNLNTDVKQTLVKKIEKILRTNAEHSDFYIEMTLNWIPLPLWSLKTVQKKFRDYPKQNIQESLYLWSHIKDQAAKEKILSEIISLKTKLDPNSRHFLRDFVSHYNYEVPKSKNWQVLLKQFEIKN